MEVIADEFALIPSIKEVLETMEALRPRGVLAELMETGIEALERIKALVPAGASVMTASSQTLDQIGLTKMLSDGDHPWVDLKQNISNEKDQVKKEKMLIESSMADYYLGSVHAVSKRGELVFGSASGSQLPSYCYTSKNVIWVVGVQKITSNVATAIERVLEYCLPKEDEYQKQKGNKSGSWIGKLLIFEHESPFLHRKIHLLFVNEHLGV